ncbi:hypothetical protein [Ensifer aridi]|uniref:hypothetical protein n=1 Tax=Ensifer aridi TaxID=1708715 RepID=UPI000A117DF9|nr:hypothetical protein [Ensifer aridi]
MPTNGISFNDVENGLAFTPNFMALRNVMLQAEERLENAGIHYADRPGIVAFYDDPATGWVKFHRFSTGWKLMSIEKRKSNRKAYGDLMICITTEEMEAIKRRALEGFYLLNNEVKAARSPERRPKTKRAQS